MANESSGIVQKFWNYCKVLCDDGVSYNDYLEQLTWLLFLKMVEEQNQHFTFKTNPFRFEDLQDFIQCFNPENRH
ncbi:type I restriction-modification system subunit M N-terminal domain-containing protein [Nodularia sphaerocarpa]|uniref:type I restriction-modification system subunit M N-terminal domain-containing protein n=1 Tax=Nodularia sphaerocarpa TaxID=137816 RepID=UPI001EFB09FF|nr:type I restriction-modification system subunit M N-terminal domain-containing protein [Nodularia sphaerocarpa]MDB9372188.1 type I restriction-modification system subunit M N-terminal domain-containing protein [Nodularia sphaerocarpa CS-585]MDB9379110.1 type I restriction-modification system subunit M N-terminal domain-containing protein [Nodularia sphaerocarpa CS-585A2]ULP72259.1 Type I restriction enzyme EcoKI M protein [Nodularia sphaerocarpa UHCC 0038]